MRTIKIFVLAITVMMAGEAFAQKKEKQKKPSLTKAETLVNKSLESELSADEVATALDILNQATTYEKTMNKSRTWYLRGMMYKYIYNGENEYEGISKNDALKNSGESFQKSMDLGTSSDIYSGKAILEIDGLWGGLLNEGVQFYNDGAMADAVTAFEACSLVKPTDTTGYLYAGSAAAEIQDFEAAQRNYKKLVELVPSENYYTTLISFEKDGLKDYDQAMATVQKAKEVLGADNQTLGKYEIDILILTKQVEPAINKIDEALKAEPDNAILHLRKGLLFDQLGANEKKKENPDQEKLDKYLIEAQAAYQKTTELDPTNITAFFNYSITYNDQANKLYNELNAMGIKEYNKNKTKYNDEATVYLEKALPLMESAYALAPEDGDILFALESFYTRMEKKDKLAEITKKLEELGLLDDK